MRTFDRTEFDRLASSYCDDALSETELAELERAIGESIDLRRRFLELTALHGHLAWSGDAPEPISPPRNRKGWRFAALAAVLAASLLLALVLGPRADRRQPDSTASVARLAEFERTQVVGPDGRPNTAEVGATVPPGYTVRTGDEAGRAVLAFDNGTRIEVGAASAAAIGTWASSERDGPDGQSIALEYGVLQAVVSRSGSIPLVLTTPHAVVRLMSVATLVCTASADATRVEVLEGSADLVRGADGRTLELGAGRYAVATRDPVEPLVARRLDSRSALPRFDVRVSGRAFALSPDGKRLATTAGDKVTIWDGRTGKVAFALPTLGRAVLSTAFSPDGKTLAGARSNDTVTAWNLETQAILADDSTPPSPRLVAYSSDGRWLATACQHSDSPAQIQIRDVTADVPPRLLAVDDASVLSLSFAPGGKELAAGTPGRGVVVWDLIKGTERAALRWDFRRRDRVDPVVYSPDGRWLAGSFANRSAVRIWDAVALTEKATLSGQGRVFRSLAFSADGRRIAGGTLDGTLFVWRVDTGEEISCDKLDTRTVRFLAYSADGSTLTTVTETGLVQYWSVAGE